MLGAGLGRAAGWCGGMPVRRGINRLYASYANVVRAARVDSARGIDILAFSGWRALRPRKRSWGSTEPKRHQTVSNHSAFLGSPMPPGVELGTAHNPRTNAPRGTARNAASHPMSCAIGLDNRREQVTQAPSDITLPTPLPAAWDHRYQPDQGASKLARCEIERQYWPAGHRSMPARQLHDPILSYLRPTFPASARLPRLPPPVPTRLRLSSLPPLDFGKFWTEHSGSEDAPHVPGKARAASQQAHDAGRRWERGNCVAALLYCRHSTCWVVPIRRKNSARATVAWVIRISSSVM